MLETALISGLPSWLTLKKAKSCCSDLGFNLKLANSIRQCVMIGT